MHGAEQEPRPADLKGRHQRRARDLRRRDNGRALLHRRQHQLARDAEEAHLAVVVEEGQSLAVSCFAFRDVRDEVMPVRAETPQELREGGQVFADLLDRDQVEAVDDLSDVGVVFA